MIINLLIIKSVCKLSSKIVIFTNYLFWGIKPSIEKSLIVFGPCDSTEFNPFQYIMFKILKRITIPYIYGRPVRPTLFYLISHKFSISTPLFMTNWNGSIFWETIRIQEQISIFSWITKINFQRVFLFNFVYLSMVLFSKR
jgi:hypothetical protein